MPKRVLLVPARRANPYLELLAAALREAGFDVEFGNPHLRWLKQQRTVPDVVHVHWPEPFLRGRTVIGAVANALVFLGILSAARVLRRRLVFTVHNLRPHESRWPWLEQLVNRILCRLAHVVTVHYPEAVSEVVNRFWCPRPKVHVIPHGAYVQQGSAERSHWRRVLGLPSESFVVLALGNIRRYKRLEKLIREFIRVMPASARLIVAGQPEPEDLVRELRDAAGPDPRVTLRAERLPEEDVEGLLAAADVFVQPSPDQLTSGSILLAMGAGLPVVAADTGHARFLCQHQPELLFDPTREHDLGRALTVAASRADLRAIGRAGRTRADDFPWSRSATELAALYRSG